MSQTNFDSLRKLTESRFKLTMVVSRRAAQLKYGVPATTTGKAIPREKNAVSAAMEELVAGSGVKWGDNLPTHEEIMHTLQTDNGEKHDKTDGAFTVTRDDNDDDLLPKIPMRGAYRPKP